MQCLGAAFYSRRYREIAADFTVTWGLASTVSQLLLLPGPHHCVFALCWLVGGPPSAILQHRPD
jgi:hypothetical protein